MAKHKKKLNPVWIVLFILVALVEFIIFINMLLQGKNVALFNPKGLIAQEQFNLILFSICLMLLIAIPSIILFYFVAWKYRESNTKAKHDPEKKYGKSFNFLIWGIPSLFVVVLTFVMIPATHRLEPQKTISANAKPITIQVVSLRWKWLFIYPEQNIATVNYVQLPIDTPVTFELTADEAPMSSFWIPNLGGQLYTMTGHVNRLNLVANTPGKYPGSSAEINGAGFAGMKFNAYATQSEDFDLWVQQVKQSPDTLDSAAYDKLLKPSVSNPAAFYSSYESDLYDKVVMKYSGSHEGSHGQHKEKEYEHYTGH